MISLAKSQVKNEATSLCNDFQKIGAGGFVWQKDEYYHVISSAYLNKNDCVLVQNSIKNKGIDSEIVSVHFDSFILNGSFDENEGKVLSKTINVFEEYYHNLYDIAISFDTSVYNEISARMAVNNAHSNFSSTLANFETIFENQYNSSPIKELHEALEKALLSSKTLCSGLPISSEQTYSSLIKYHYLEILNIAYTLEIWKKKSNPCSFDFFFQSTYYLYFPKRF